MTTATQTVEISDDALKLLVAEHGVRGTARLLGMTDTQTDTFRQRVTRGKWLADPAIASIRAKSANVQIGRPAALAVAALSPQAALSAELAALGAKSRLSLARGIAKGSEFVETLTGPEVLNTSGDIKALAQTADLVHGWKDSAPQVKIRLDVLSGSAESPQIHDIEATEIESISATPIDDCDLDSY